MTGSGSAGKHYNGNEGRVGRRSFLKAAGAGAAVTGVAGCLGGGGGGGGGGIPDTIKIGVLAPHPGNNTIGASIANAAKVAAKDINDNGGVDGSNVEVIVKDTAEKPSTGKDKYRTLVSTENVHATTGVFTSEVLLSLTDLIARNQTVHMTTGAASPEVSKKVSENYDKYKYHFRTGPINAHHLGVNMVDFAEANFDAMGWDKVAVLVEDFTWTTPVSDVLNDQLSGVGAEIVMNKRYSGTTKNFKPLFDQAQNAGADGLFTAMAHTGSAAITQWYDQQRPFGFGGIHVPMQLPNYDKAVGGKCNYGVTQNSATPQSELTSKTQPFVQGYRDYVTNNDDAYAKSKHRYPVYTGYITYDAVRQYAKIVGQKGSVGSDDVVSGLEASEYLGTTGTITYYGKDKTYAHDVKYGQEYVFPIYQQWQGSGTDLTQEIIFPEEYKTADYQQPSWI